MWMPMGEVGKRERGGRYSPVKIDFHYFNFLFFFFFFFFSFLPSKKKEKKKGQHRQRREEKIANTMDLHSFFRFR